MDQATPRFDGPAPKKNPRDNVLAAPTVSETRKRNLLWLRKQFEEDLLRKFPDEPRLGLDKKFSERIGLNPKYFGHIKQGRRNVGNALARNVEETFRLPVGWMDVSHADTAGGTEEEDQLVSSVLALYRTNPDATRAMILRALQDHMGRKLKK